MSTSVTVAISTHYCYQYSFIFFSLLLHQDSDCLERTRKGRFGMQFLKLTSGKKGNAYWCVLNYCKVLVYISEYHAVASGEEKVSWANWCSRTIGKLV